MITSLEADTLRTAADVAVLWYDRDGVVLKLMRLAPHYRCVGSRNGGWHRAYGRGFDAGASAVGSERDNPYGRAGFRAAWRAGWSDGQRVRTMLTTPEYVADLRHAEYKLLDRKLRARVDANDSGGK